MACRISEEVEMAKHANTAKGRTKWDRLQLVWGRVQEAWRFVPLELKIMAGLIVLLVILSFWERSGLGALEKSAFELIVIAAFAVLWCIFIVLICKEVLELVRGWKEKPERFRNECGYFVQEVSDALRRMGSHHGEGRDRVLSGAGEGLGPVSSSEKAWLIKRYIEIWRPAEAAPFPSRVLRVLSVAVPTVQLVVSIFEKIDPRQVVSEWREESALMGSPLPVAGTGAIVLVLWILSIMYRRKHFVVTTAMRLWCERELGGIDRDGMQDGA
ncbi:hypothetical protein H8R18_06570 [Nanchangia anserum]|uniref:Uncharacterized protein n=1 Tax=Nanchangia anserum TaxID=2692125 RepID=A0A8I0KNE4_9ACTO|nr:hypothetical protein [Nanchangia anserum]MBD3689196.1 hypothetical protein [Nanchangia anserum]QOX81422.1 hypothetical protein H8R18_06570 [Nanchangia anserum]